MMKWILRLLYCSVAAFILGAILWMFYPAQTYETGQHKPIQLLGDFHSFMSPQEVGEALGASGTSAEATSDGLRFNSKHIDMKSIEVENFKGDVVFSFINYKLFRIKISPENFEDFRQYIDDNSRPEEFRKINIPESSDFIVISDSRLADEFVSHMRRYGSN